MSQAKIWYVVIDGKADGPHTQDQLIQWINSGKVGYSDLVFRPGLSKWVTVAECKEFERRGTNEVASDTVVQLDTPESGIAEVELSPNDSSSDSSSVSGAADSGPQTSGSSDQDQADEQWTALVRHAQVNGKNHYIQSGPYGTDKIKEKLKKGEIKYDDHLWKKGMKSWTVISTIPEFDRRAVHVEPELPPTPESAEFEVALEKDNQTEAVASTAQTNDSQTPAPFWQDDSVGYHSDTNISDVFEKTESRETTPQVLKPEPVVPKTQKVEKVVEKVQVEKPSKPVPQAEEKMPDLTPLWVTDQVEKPKASKSASKALPDLTPAEVKPKVEKVKVEKATAEKAKAEVKSKTEAKLKPEAKAEAKPKATPKVETKPAPKAAPVVQAASDEITAVTRIHRKEVQEEVEEVPVETPEVSDENTSGTKAAPARKKASSSKWRRYAIGAAGASLAMAMTYAGREAYKDLLHQQWLKKGGGHVTAPTAQHQVPPPSAMPPAAEAQGQIVAVNGAQPQRPQPQPQAAMPSRTTASQEAAAADPEMANPANKTANALKVVALKTADHPQLAIETDAPAGTEMTVEITASAGSILQYPSFYLKKKVVVVPGQMPTLDLGADHLPAGTYKALVSGGGQTDKTTIFVGLHDSEFKKRLAEYRKVVAKKQKEEKDELVGGTEFVTRSFASFAKDYKKARTTASPDARKTWTQNLKKWRKDYEQQIKAIKSVTEANRNKFVYPEQLMKLHEAQKKILEVSKIYDHALKAASRNGASEDENSEIEKLNEARQFRKDRKKDGKKRKEKRPARSSGPSCIYYR